MKLVMERRTETPISLMLISPLIAVVLTLISAAIMFALLGKDPVTALSTYFLDPLSDSWGLQEVAVKATPLVLIAVGLGFATARRSGISAPRGNSCSVPWRAAISPSSPMAARKALGFCR
jgi:ABC-type uncharacterized transport system permease subunit